MSITTFIVCQLVRLSNVNRYENRMSIITYSEQYPALIGGAFVLFEFGNKDFSIVRFSNGAGRLVFPANFQISRPAYNNSLVKYINVYSYTKLGRRGLSK